MSSSASYIRLEVYNRNPKPQTLNPVKPKVLGLEGLGLGDLQAGVHAGR